MVQGADQLDAQLGCVEHVAVCDGKGYGRNRLAVKGIVVGIFNDSKTARGKADTGDVACGEVSGTS